MQPNKFLQGVLGLLALVLIVFVGAEARNAFESYNYIGKIVRDRDTITIQGTGKISAAPDVAVLSLGVTSDGMSVKDVQTQNTQKMNAIIAALKAMNIANKDIQTSNYSIYPKYDWTNNRQNLTGYTVSQNVTVKIRNLDSTGDVLAKAGELGMNQTGGVQFTIDEPQKLQADAREKAIQDAKQKAQQLADQLGLSVVKVVTFSENFGGSPIVSPMVKAMDVGMAAPSVAPSPDIQSGSLDVTSDVSVTFEVR